MTPRPRAITKLAAAALSLALLLPSPLFAAELAAIPDVGVGMGVGALAVPAPVTMPAVALGGNIVISPIASADLGFQPAATLSAMPSAAAAAAVAQHPALSIINELRSKGFALPDGVATRADAEKLIVAAQSIPSPALREKMTAMAHAAVSAGTSSGEGSAAFSAAFDNAKGAASNAEAPSALRAIANKIPVVGAYLKSRDQKRALANAKPIDPTSRELSSSQVRWTAPVEMLPASTREHKEDTIEIVGQQTALQNIKFGLEMREDPQHKGSRFNLYISGPNGSGRETALKSIVEPLAKGMETPTDLVAASNFKDPDEPVILELKSGNAEKFKEAVDGFTENFGMAVLQAMHAPEIVKQKKAVEAERDKAIEKRQAALDGAIADIRLEVASENNEWSVKLIEVQGNLVALPTFRRKGSREEFQAFASKAEVDAAISSGKLTRAEFQAALTAAQAEGKKLKDDFQKMAGQNAVSNAQAQMAIEMLNRQAASMAAQEAAQEIIPLIAEPGRHETPEHDAWQKSAEARIKAFNAEVAKQQVSAENGGKYGFIVTQDTLSEGAIGITKLKGGKMVPVADAQAEGLTQNDLEAIITAAKPFIEKLEKLVASIGAEHDKLHETDPPYEKKGMEYLNMLMTFAAVNYQAFLPHDHEATKGKPHFEPEELVRVNVLQSNEPGSGAPVIWESNPTYARIFGKAEGGKKRMMMDGMAQVAKMPGGPIFESGSYLEARGGFLILDVMQVLREPGVWPALMQAVRNGEAEIAEEGLMGLYSNGDKYHVAGKTKIVFIGSPYIKMMLEHYDEDFAAGFQAPVAEFGSKLEINKDTIEGYLDFMKNVIRKAKGLIMDFERDGIAAILEASARDMDSNKKLSAQFGISDIRMRKASQAAADRLKADASGPKGVTRADVEKVRELDLQSDALHSKSYQEILRDNIFILDNMGEPIVGQINGLAVMGAFGAPMRKTFKVQPGGEGIQVESLDRNIGTTGPSYNKAIEVINGFINSAFPSKKPWHAKVTISAEQNYGGIDGDSATSTQIYGVLSALSGIGIKPTMAVTGSADQFGNVQAIGGVNEKIEGFYDLCKMRGLTGTQGVMIPKSNVGDLMLKPEVVAAIKAGQFHIYAVDNVKDGWEIMTGTSFEVAKAKALEKLKSFRR